MTNQIALPASNADKLRYIQMLESGEFDENLLETALIVVPDLFDPIPFFCGRQLPIESVALDLLSFGVYDCLTVYELKARKVRRQDVCQALDYALAVREMDTEDLTWHLIRRSRDSTEFPVWTRRVSKNA